MIPSPHERLPRQGLLLLAALSLFWGANWPIMKMVLSEVPPLYFRGVCLLLGGVGMLALARVSGVSLRVPAGQWRRVLWLALFNIVGWNALVIIGVSLLPSGRAALLGYTMPLWSMTLSILFLGERLTVRDVPAAIRAELPPELAGSVPRGGALSLEDSERQMIVRALRAHEGNVTKAAADLGISRRTLHRKLNEYGLREGKSG